MAASLTKTQAYVASQWEEQTSGSALTVTLIEDNYLWIKQTLETTDDSATPMLTEMILAESTQLFTLYIGSTKIVKMYKGSTELINFIKG
jgi:hypothetical protein